MQAETLQLCIPIRIFTQKANLKSASPSWRNDAIPKALILQRTNMTKTSEHLVLPNLAKASMELQSVPCVVANATN